MQLPKLVIASILKPVDDTRMYEKFGVSISQTDKYEVNIIGFSSKKRPDNKNIKFHPIFDFNRISLGRIVAPLRYLIQLFKIQPKIIIITTHELIWASLVYKAFKPCRIIYDLRENYYLNIRHTNAFPPLIKNVIASYVRSKEKVSAGSIDHFILAEKCYAQELPFLKNKYTVIENKSTKFRIREQTKKMVNEGEITLLFSGTIAESTGVFDVINLAKNLHQIDNKIRLKIIGKASQKSTLYSIQNLINKQSFITLVGGDKLVPHKEILNAILSSDFGVIYYPPNVAYDRCIPTKLYEYLHANLPILTDHKPVIKSITDEYNAAIHIDFSNYDAPDLLKQMYHTQFYQKLPKSEVLWDHEASKLIEIIST
ncbi:glycosyltransferase family protein [Fulvivirga lutea]|uniref:Glycosyltransferase n=1 Tax=Fulvivirga lutea TaxID=2810512 RepID=A0A974WGD3_9BACT|nr:glycosyltransferase [Fulvivirga lutea]QSE96667.1 glycosyltransferase [Fulvivirga lutea]